MDNYARSIHPIMEMLGSLGIAGCCFDVDDQAVAWNRHFLQMFPEHSGHIHVGEHYAENLRRFYTARLTAEEMPHMARYIADGIERHRNQYRPYEFRHRGQWLRVASLPIEGLGRARIWMPIPAPDDSDSVALAMALSGQHTVMDGLADIADGVLACDPNGVITFANARFTDIYQFDPLAMRRSLRFEDVLAEVWGSHPGAEAARNAVRDHLRFPGAPFVVPLPGDRWVRCTNQRSYEGSLVSTHVDITVTHRLQRDTTEARRRAESLAASLTEKIAELEASNRRIELLLALMPGGLLRMRYLEDAPMELIYCSPDAAALTGFPLADMSPELFVSRISGEDRIRVRAKVNEALTSGATTIEIDFQHRDGNWRRVHGTFRAASDSEDSSEVVMLWTDVTDERTRLIQDAQASRLLTLGEMASGIAHELNQPLTTISLLAATATMELRHTPGDPTAALQKLARLGEQSLRAGRIIHTLHDMTRPGTGELARVSLPDAVAQTRLLVDQMMRNAAISLEIDLPDDLPLVVGDQTRIQQTLMNLFSNARDALARSKPGRPSIRVSAMADHGAVVLAIADNAGGVDQAVIDRVFDPFFTTKGPDQGTGLGLSIARAAIQSMQGDISVHNEDGGAVFTLRLRAVPPAEAAAR